MLCSTANKKKISFSSNLTLPFHWNGWDEQEMHETLFHLLCCDIKYHAFQIIPQTSCRMMYKTCFLVKDAASTTQKVIKLAVHLDNPNCSNTVWSCITVEDSGHGYLIPLIWQHTTEPHTRAYPTTAQHARQYQPTGTVSRAWAVGGRGWRGREGHVSGHSEGIFPSRR